MCSKDSFPVSDMGIDMGIERKRTAFFKAVQGYTAYLIM